MFKSVAIIAAKAVPVGKIQTRPSEKYQSVEHEILAGVVANAIGEAGVEKAMVDALIFSEPHVYTQQKYFSTFMAAYLGLACRGAVMEVLGNGMTGGLAFDQAADQIRLGRARVALALGVNMETATPASQHMNITMRVTGDVDFHSPAGFTPISWYAMDATRYMHEYGATRTQFAAVAVKNRRHAALNPLAQFRKPITVADVIKSRPVVEPLTLLDVPPRSDGAICIVLATEDIARGLGRPYVRLRARGSFHEGVHQVCDRPNDMIAFNAAATAGRSAYEDGGITGADIDLAEIYAPCTIVEILATEALQLTARGDGARAAAAGETALGGRIPVNTSGGCQSRGHPARLTPLYNALELFEQLTGRAGDRQVADAELALMSCELGNYNAALVHVLERAQ
jgi:acetyl-CoA acetyltransferase